MQSPNGFDSNPTDSTTSDSGLFRAKREARSEPPPAQRLIEDARRTLIGQSAALLSLSKQVDQSFVEAVQLILARPGRVAVCGIGKSGLVGRKLAATLSSTGTPAFFLHASEALHGDLGMVTSEDTVVMISNSGNTKELFSLMPSLREMRVPVVAICGGGGLGAQADVCLCVGVDREACPLNLAPTTSTLVASALGDALALALSQARGFEAVDFARVHPGGDIGRRLCSRVSDVMRRQGLPFVHPRQIMSEVLVDITQGRCGLAIVENEERKLLGVITDGDLRRALQRDPELLKRRASDIMTTCPITISEESLVEDAERMMEQCRVKALLATNRFGQVSGVIEFFSK